MPKLLLRLIVAVLVPCMVVDPAAASAFSTPTTHLLVHSIPAQNVFQEEALELAFVGARFFRSLIASVSAKIQHGAVSPVANGKPEAVAPEQERLDQAALSRYPELADYDLIESQRHFRRKVDEFSQRVIAPRAVDLDQGNNQIEDFRDLWEEIARAGYVGINTPKEYGGQGLGAVEGWLTMEAFGRASQSAALVQDVRTSLTIFPILYAGSPEQKEEFVVPAVEGKKYLAYGLTEPGSGSDSANLRTTFDKRDGKYVLNGSKHFITDGTIADHVIIFAREPHTHGHETIAAFIVPTHQGGVTVEHMNRMVGHHSTGTSLITLNDAAGTPLGEMRGGFKIAMKTLEDGRAVAINAIIQSSLETTVKEAEKAYRQGVHRAVGFHPQVVFLAPRARAKRGRAVVTGAGIDAVEDHHPGWPFA